MPEPSSLLLIGIGVGVIAMYAITYTPYFYVIVSTSYPTYPDSILTEQRVALGTRWLVSVELGSNRPWPQTDDESESVPDDDDERCSPSRHGRTAF